MNRTSRILVLTSLVALSLGAPACLHAQTPERDAALAATGVCLGHADALRLAPAKETGAEAEALLTQYFKRSPQDADAIVALARVTSQCLLPAAEFAEQGELSTRAIELLDHALSIAPTHWMARFVLASILYRSPSFLGRGPRAAKELDILLDQQGSSTTSPRFARTFELRGMLWKKAGNADSARAVWQRGATLFPGDSVLVRLAAQASTPEASTTAPSPSASSSERQPTTLAPVVAVASRSRSASSVPTPSVQSVTRTQQLLAAGGSADVLQSVQLLPGATRVSEGSDIYTRGGDPAETALLVNGGRMLALSRFEGLNGGMFGALEPFVVKTVRYSSGGFSVRHGNALSGVLEIDTDDRPRERQLRAGISLVQLSGTVRTPLGPKVGGWISGRASNTMPLLATHGRTAEFEGAPHSEELIGSLIAAPTPLTELRVTGMLERDDSRRMTSAAGFDGPFHSAASSKSLQLASQWVSSHAPLIMRANVTGSSRATDFDFGVLSRERTEGNVTSRVDAEWAPSVAMTVRAGAEHGALSRIEQGTVPITMSLAPGAPQAAARLTADDAREVGGYVETQLARGPSSLTLGVRADRLPAEDEVTFDPRLSVSTRVGLWTARMSAGQFHQGRYRATPTLPNAGTPTGLARRASHLVAGIEREGATTMLRAEGYLKQYAEYAPFGSGPGITSGRSRGIDVLAQKTVGSKLTGWLGYSLIDATVTLVDGNTVRSPFDVTHSATASATLSMSAAWSIGSTFRYGTGAPITPIVGASQNADGRFLPEFGDVTSDRLPAYGRLDARVMRYIPTPRALVSTYIEMLNLTNRHNVASITYDAAYRTREATHSFFATRTIVAGAELRFR